MSRSRPSVHFHKMSHKVYNLVNARPKLKIHKKFLGHLIYSEKVVCTFNSSPLECATTSQETCNQSGFLHFN